MNITFAQENGAKPISAEQPYLPKVEVDHDRITKESKDKAKEISDKIKEDSSKKFREERREKTLQENGIYLDSDCMLHGTCEFSIYDATKVKKDRAPAERTSVMGFLQDIILAATTFIGTVVTVALILSGLLYIFSTVDSGMKTKAQKGIKYSLIGMVIVMLALVIIRLVQFLARGGS